MDVKQYQRNHINELTQQTKKVTVEYETKIQKHKKELKKLISQCIH